MRRLDSTVGILTRPEPLTKAPFKELSSRLIFFTLCSFVILFAYFVLRPSPVGPSVLGPRRPTRERENVIIRRIKYSHSGHPAH